MWLVVRITQLAIIIIIIIIITRKRVELSDNNSAFYLTKHYNRVIILDAYKYIYPFITHQAYTRMMNNIGII